MFLFSNADIAQPAIEEDGGLSETEDTVPLQWKWNE